jgi:hypothetical protein
VLRVQPKWSQRVARHNRPSVTIFREILDLFQIVIKTCDQTGDKLSLLADRRRRISQEATNAIVGRRVQMHQIMGQMPSELGGAASFALVRIGNAFAFPQHLVSGLQDKGAEPVPFCIVSTRHPGGT